MVACEQCGKPEHKTKLKKKRFCSPACARQAKASIGEQVAQAQQLQQQQQAHQQQQQQQQSESINNANINLNDSNNTSHHLNNSINMDMSNSLSAAPMVAVGAAGIQTDNTIMQNLPIVTTASQLQMQQAAPPTSSSSSVANVSAVVNESAPLAPTAATTAAPAVEQQPQMANWTVSDVCEFIKNLPGCSDYVDDFEQQEIDGQALLLLKENHLVNAMGMKLGPALKIVAKVESMKEVSAAALNAANNAMDTNNGNSQ